jgi:hypothetical protein
VSPAAGEQIEIRILKTVNFAAGEVKAFEGAVLTISLASGAATAFLPGSLVEARTTGMIYLGEIKDCEGSKLTLGIEHAIDRQALTQIQQAWRRQ